MLEKLPKYERLWVYVKETYDVMYSISDMRQLLHRLLNASD